MISDYAFRQWFWQLGKPLLALTKCKAFLKPLNTPSFYSYGRLAQYDQAYSHAVKRPSINFAQSLRLILLNSTDKLVEWVTTVQLPFTKKKLKIKNKKNSGNIGWNVNGKPFLVRPTGKFLRWTDRLKRQSCFPGWNVSNGSPRSIYTFLTFPHQLQAPDAVWRNGTRSPRTEFFCNRPRTNWNFLLNVKRPYYITLSLHWSARLLEFYAIEYTRRGDMVPASIFKLVPVITREFLAWRIDQHGKK